MKFVLEIELGNERMRTYQDVQGAIVASLARNSGGYLDELLKNEYSSQLRDINGNTVGKWEVVEG